MTVTNVVEDNQEVNTVYADFANTFDSVNINKLISKLKHYGIDSSLK